MEGGVLGEVGVRRELLEGNAPQDPTPPAGRPATRLLQRMLAKQGSLPLGCSDDTEYAGHRTYMRLVAHWSVLCGGVHVCGCKLFAHDHAGIA